jgi:hypothetical protein
MQFYVYMIHIMHCKHSTQVVYIVPLQNPWHTEALWVCRGVGEQMYRKLKFAVGCYRLDFVSLADGSTLDSSYDTFACLIFSLLFFIFNVPIAYSELLQMKTGEFKTETDWSNIHIPRQGCKGQVQKSSETQ